MGSVVASLYVSCDLVVSVSSFLQYPFRTHVSATGVADLFNGASANFYALWSPEAETCWCSTFAVEFLVLKKLSQLDFILKFVCVCVCARAHACALYLLCLRVFQSVTIISISQAPQYNLPKKGKKRHKPKKKEGRYKLSNAVYVVKMHKNCGYICRETLSYSPDLLLWQLNLFPCDGRGSSPR